MSERLIIRDGLVIDPAQQLESKRDILLENGRIRAVAPALSRRSPRVPVLDARGCWVVPGLIDLHAHLRQPGGEDAETIASGTLAAAAGGFTTVVAMPNTIPPTDTLARLRRVRRIAEREAVVSVLFTACATLGQGGRRLSDLAAMAKHMAAATEDGRALADSDLMRAALALLRRLRRPFLSHCEDAALSRGAPVNEGRASRRLGLPGQPWLAEAMMVQRDIALAKETGARLHLCHLSCRASVEALRQAKAAGALVTAEVTPHHLALCEDDLPGPDPDFKMNPPLRSRADRRALQEALCDGTIDAVATDHAPHSPASKRRGMARSPFGVIGLETAVGVVMTVLVRQGRLSPAALVERMSTAPARILGLERKGSLRPGMDADLAIVDPRQEWTVPARSHSLSRNSPFIGRRLAGRVRATVCAGRIVHAL